MEHPKPPKRTLFKIDRPASTQSHPLNPPHPSNNNQNQITPITIHQEHLIPSNPTPPIPPRTSNQFCSSRSNPHNSKDDEQNLIGTYSDYLRNSEETNGKTFTKYREEFPEWESYESILIKACCLFNDNFRFDNNYIYLYLFELQKNFRNNIINNISQINNCNYQQPTPMNCTPYHNDNHLREECFKFYTYKQNTLFQITNRNQNNINHCYEMLKITAKIYHKINGLTEIDISNYDCNSDLIQLVISAVKFNGTVQKLIFTGNQFGENACYWLGTMLRNNSKVIDIDLSNCCITNNCLKMLNEGLKSSNSKINTFHLEKIRLSENKITSEGAYELSCLLDNFSYLKWLNISKNALGNQGFKILLLKYEELLLMKSSHCTNLETLIVISNQIREEDSLEVLARIVENSNCKLKKLILSENNISNNNISSSGFLKIFFNSMKKNTSINELLLLNCNIGNNDVDCICDMFKENKTLENLNLYNNKVDEPEKFVQLLAMFSTVDGPCGNGLKEFDLSKNNCKLDTSEYVDRFLNVLEKIKLTSLDISQNFELKSQEFENRFKIISEQIQKSTKIVY